MVGLVKRVMEQQEAGGFSRGRYWESVCRYCIADPCLAAFVSDDDRIETCVFCGRADTAGVLVDDLFSYMAECLRTEWNDPVHGAAWSSRDGGYMGVELVDSDDLLSVVGEPLGNLDLREEFVSSFDHDWSPLPFYGYNRSETLIYSWQRFRRIATSKHTLAERESPMASDPWDDLIRPGEVLNAIGDAFVEGALTLGTTTSVRVFRGREHEPSEELGTVADLGPPPSHIAGHNRMSRAGVSVFYGAESETTTLAEVKTCGRTAVTLASWKPSREIWYLDLLAAEPIPSIFDLEASLDRQVLLFLDAFARDLARPISDEDKAIEYIPTQIATEYVRDRILDGVVDAIRYPSAVDRPDGVCWVVFTDHADCMRPNPLMILDPDSVRRYEASYS